MRNHAITDTLPDVEKEIHHLAWRFQKRYGGDIEELRSEAFLAFTEAYNLFDVKRGAQFHTWLWHHVWYRLWQNANKIVRNYTREKPVQQETNELALQNASKGPGFDIDRFAGELSEDAQIMLKLVAKAPVELLNVGDPLRGPGWLIDCIKNHLLDAGWSGKRFLQSFDEIREALVA